MTFHQHYWWFSSPDDEDALGSQNVWFAEEGVLLLDAYPHKDREAVLHRAFGQRAHVWVLRLGERSAESTRDLRSLVTLRAQRFARLP